MMMMIVRTAPDAARAQDEKPENPHEYFRRFRPRQNRVMLLVVVNDKHPDHQEPRGDTTGDLAYPMKIDERACEGGGEKKRGGDHVPPALECGIGGEGPGRNQ